MSLETYIKELFSYDLETGWFINLRSRGRAGKGNRAGYEDVHGYRRICIDGTKFYEHHLAWLYVTGVMPDEIDHKNGIRSENWFLNLRECNRSQNSFNTLRTPGISGLNGAYLDRRNLQWFSKIQVGGQQKFLGNFNSAEEASEAYQEALKLYAGEFAYTERMN
jgi:HNH endonuclease